MYVCMYKYIYYIFSNNLHLPMKLATKVVSGEPILNNDTQSPAEKSNVWRLKKLMKIFWVRKFYHENEKEREILKTLLWIFTFIYNAAIDFLYIIPYYSQQIQKIIFYGTTQFFEGMEITFFIKNKIICACRFTLHSLLCSLF